VGPFAQGALLQDMTRVLDTGSAPERAAAVLALRHSTDPQVQALLARHQVVHDAVQARHIDWATVQEFS